MKRTLAVLLLCASLIGCTQRDSQDAEPKTKLIYFGYDDRSETPKQTVQMAADWGNNPACPHWRATIKREYADYEVLFSAASVIIVDRKGAVIYGGDVGVGPLYLPYGNPDGSGVNICKLTGGAVQSKAHAQPTR